MASGDAGASTAGRATSSTTATFGMATSAPRGTPAAPRGVPAAARVGRATGALDNFYLDDRWMPIYVVVGCWFVDSSFRRCRGCGASGPRRAGRRVHRPRESSRDFPATRSVDSKQPRPPGDPAANARGRTDSRESARHRSGALFSESFLNVRHRPRDRHVPAPEGSRDPPRWCARARADPFPVRAVGVATPPSSRAVGPFDNRGNAGGGNIPTALPRNARFRCPATKRPPPTSLPVPLVRAARARADPPRPPHPSANAGAYTRRAARARDETRRRRAQRRVLLLLPPPSSTSPSSVGGDDDGGAPFRGLRSAPALLRRGRQVGRGQGQIRGVGPEQRQGWPGEGLWRTGATASARGRRATSYQSPPHPRRRRMASAGGSNSGSSSRPGRGRRRPRRRKPPAAASSPRVTTRVTTRPVPATRTSGVLRLRRVQEQSRGEVPGDQAHVRV